MAELQLEEVEELEDTQKNKYLTFVVGREVYGIEIKYVTEIIGFQAITEVPELPDYIKGIINLRGKIIPVMDVRLRFKKESLDYNDRTCVIVIEVNEFSVGLIVDSVADVLDIPEAEVAPPPQFNKEQQSKYIKAVGKVAQEVILLVNCEKLLTETDMKTLAAVE